MKLLILNSLILLVGLVSYAQPYQTDLTVVAVSGLNMREEPSLNSKKICSIPFGTIIQGQNSITDGHEIELDGLMGKWVQAQYKGLTGFVFSAYIYRGKWVAESKGDINKDFRLLQEGFYCESINYSPYLHWYALLQNGTSTILKKVNVSITLYDELDISQLERTGEEAPNGRPFLIETDIKEKSILLLGTKRELKKISHVQIPELIDFERSGNKTENSSFTSFAFLPNKSLSFQSNSYLYHLKTKETPDSLKKANWKQKNDWENYSVDGVICEVSNEEAGEFTFDFSEDLGHPGLTTFLTHSFETPKLLWSGDLNGDNIQDFIFKTMDSFDGCGGAEFIQLFLSDLDPHPKIRLVAEEYKLDCIAGPEPYRYLLKE